MIRLAGTGCYWIKGVGQNMKWSKALNAEQSGLMAMDFAMYGSIAEARKAEFHYIDPDGGAAKHELVVAEAEYIMNAIWDEIEDVWRRQELGEDIVSSLEVATNGSHDGGWHSVSKDQCRFSKESLALWFYQMDGIDKAKIFNPHFDPQHIPIKKCVKPPPKESPGWHYPLKLELAIGAHRHFWVEQNAGEQPTNNKVETWLTKTSKDLGLTHIDSGESLPGISQKAKEVITQLIKPDDT